ncbi:MAG: nitroreductase family protein [Patulibacter sp.]|nr:nitroreductase family protein [Patulibacter sp.]
MIDLIRRRRSIRSGFSDRPVPASTIDRIVGCGLAAPSSKNAQPWRLHVVDRRPLLSALATAVAHAEGADQYVPIDPTTGRPRPNWQATVRESADVLASVPLGIFLENSGRFSDGRRTIATADPDVRENALVGYGLEMLGLGASVQSMWLAAEHEGLRGVFMGDVLIAEDAIREHLGMRGDLVGVLALGYSSAPPAPRRRVDDRVVRHGSQPVVELGAL